MTSLHKLHAADMTSCNTCAIGNSRHFEWQKCIAVIEVSNASDYTPTKLVYTDLCACILKYTSLVGVVTCVGEERYAPISQSLQYISATQNGGYHAEVYGRIRPVAIPLRVRIHVHDL